MSLVHDNVVDVLSPLCLCVFLLLQLHTLYAHACVVVVVVVDTQGAGTDDETLIRIIVARS